MKHAIIILGHKNVPQIIRLISQLNHSSFDVFLHLNKLFNVSIEQKEIFKNLNSGSVYLIPDDERVTIQYDGMGMTNAILKGLEAAFENRLNRESSYKYYLFITAQDYPIKPNSYIENELINLYPKPIIDIHPWSNNNWAYHKFKKFYFHQPRTFIRGLLQNWTYKLIGKFVRAPFEIPTLIFEYIYTILRKSPKTILTSKGYHLFGGAPWFLLPDFIVEYLIKNIRGSDIYSILKYTITPDETLIHTFLMNSKYKHYFKIEGADDPKRYTHTYEIFSDERND